MKYHSRNLSPSEYSVFKHCFLKNFLESPDNLVHKRLLKVSSRSTGFVIGNVVFGNLLSCCVHTGGLG